MTEIEKMTPEKNKHFAEAGWKQQNISFKSNNKKKPYTRQLLYVRERDLDEFSMKSSEPWDSQNRKSIGAQGLSDSSRTGSNIPMGSGTKDLNPDACSDGLTDSCGIGSFPSVQHMRSQQETLVVGFDSEWQNTPQGRTMLSWQFSVACQGKLVEFVFLQNSEEPLSLQWALGCILDYLGYAPVDLRKYRRYTYSRELDERGMPKPVKTGNLEEARSSAVYLCRCRNFTSERILERSDCCSPANQRDWRWFYLDYDFSSLGSIPVCLVCHAGKVDISTLLRDEKPDIMPLLSEIQGGLVSRKTIPAFPIMSPSDIHRHKVHYISLSVRDTMCHAPADMKSLACLGQLIGVPKVEVSDCEKKDMSALLRKNPVRFFQYASTDSTITLLYAASLYGWNRAVPLTVTSAAASVMKGSMMEYLACNTPGEFNLVYRGLKKLSRGLTQREDCPAYLANSQLAPVSDAAHSVQYYATQAYHGGYNGCSEVGYFPEDTWDYDLKNAYPTAMCLVPDIHWDAPVETEIRERALCLEDWANRSLLTPFFGYVTFSFPESVAYPCIPVNVDGCLVYPRTSSGLDGVYTTGQHIFLALKLGASVYCQKGYFLRTRKNKDGQESRCLSIAVKQLVKDREHAKKRFGKGSLAELLLKMMVSSGYGKVAQGVVEKRHWDAQLDKMVCLGASPITSPVSAALITSLVQCVLLAAQNQCHDLGHMTCSVTTDGFISNCPEEVLKSLDLYGFRSVMEDARSFLTDGENSALWECKHTQNDLVNFTTRGNVSLLPHGVCAHNSAKSDYPSDSFQDRLWLMTQVLSREGPVAYSSPLWTSFKELLQGKDFTVQERICQVRMDFDMKRKPDLSGLRTDTVEVDGRKYHIAHFATSPFEDVQEFQHYRNVKEQCKVLRTVEDWYAFRDKLCKPKCCDKGGGKKIRDMSRSILLSCIMGYRAGLYRIPPLDDRKRVKDKIDYINQHSLSEKPFQESDWKNCRKPERQALMLPDDMVAVQLRKLGGTFG